MRMYYGVNLDFIQYVKINGLKCAKISETDVEQRIEYWNSSIVRCVLGGNHSFNAIDVVGLVFGRIIRFIRLSPGKAVCSLPWRIMIRFLKGETFFFLIEGLAC